jgi:D-psicose/D-tagatose/L-ribulose 3-epimerase
VEALKRAISNIAWSRELTDDIVPLLDELGVDGVEVAPTAVWDDPLHVSRAAVSKFKDYWESRSLSIVAFQALLYGHPDLQLFDGVSERERTLDHLSRISALAGRLGVPVLVFGSPKNRKVGDMESRRAFETAVEFFAAAAIVAESEGTVLAIEPNPPAYECDFVRTAAEGLELVKAVSHPGFGLHLDAAAMTLVGDDPLSTFEAARDWQAHFHVSEPYLASPGRRADDAGAEDAATDDAGAEDAGTEDAGAEDAGTEDVGTRGTSTDHAGISEALRAVGYSGWCSLEMRRPEAEIVAEVRRALVVQREWYGDE